jgi:hypothetical protein
MRSPQSALKLIGNEATGERLVDLKFVDVHSRHQCRSTIRECVSCPPECAGMFSPLG